MSHDADNHQERVLAWFAAHNVEYPEVGFDPESGAGQLGVVQMFLEDREIFVGPPTLTGPWEVEVAALIRENVPFAAEVIMTDLIPYRLIQNDRHFLELVDGDDDSFNSVWLYMWLSEDETSVAVLDELIPEFLAAIDHVTPLL